MKKIAMIIPSLLLTGCLFSCGKATDPFVIESEEKFNDAISFKDVKYVQLKYQQMIISNTATIYYQEHYASPTVYGLYSRSIQAGDVSDPSERYVRKDSEGKCWVREKNNEGIWFEKLTDESEFKNPSELSPKNALESYNVTYNLVKDNYDKNLQGYYFNIEKGGRLYSFVLSFYKNHLTYFSYEYLTSSLTLFNAFNYTYGEITPDLPDIPES